MTPDEVGTQIAARTYAALQTLGLRQAQFPTRGEDPIMPSLLVHLTDAALEYGMPEQRWTCSFLGQLLIAAAGDGSTTYAYETALNSFIAPLTDAWDPSANRQNYLLSGGVDSCTYHGGQFGQLFVVNNKPYLGAAVTWTAEFRRIP